MGMLQLHLGDQKFYHLPRCGHVKWLRYYSHKLARVIVNIIGLFPDP